MDISKNQYRSTGGELREQALIKQSKINVVQWENLGIFPQNRGPESSIKKLSLRCLASYPQLTSKFH